MTVAEQIKEIENINQTGNMSITIVDETKRRIGQATHDGKIMMAYKVTKRTANNKMKEMHKEVTKVETQETECDVWSLNGYVGKSKFTRFYIHIKRLTKGNDYMHKSRIEYEPIKAGTRITL